MLDSFQRILQALDVKLIVKTTDFSLYSVYSLTLAGSSLVNCFGELAFRSRLFDGIHGTKTTSFTQPRTRLNMCAPGVRKWS